MTNISIQSQNHYSVLTLAEIRELVAADDPLLPARLRPEDPAAATACPSFADIFMAACGADTATAALYRLGLELIFEGYLLHWRTSRVLDPQSGEFSLLAGDYMYARGLESICRLQDTRCIKALADLVGFCSRMHADGAEGAWVPDAWAATTLALAHHARYNGRGPDSGADGLADAEKSTDPLGILAGAIQDIPADDANGRRLVERLLAQFPPEGSAGLRPQIDEVYSGLEKLWRSTT